ncbi:MAG: metallophosphoesterase [Candidatus Pacearchaeota archaeon]
MDVVSSIIMNNIIKIFLEKGILIDREVLGVIKNLSEENLLELVNLFCDLNLKFVNLNILRENVSYLNEKLLKKSCFDGFFKFIKSGDDSIKIISNVSFSQRKITVRNFIDYFKSRYDEIKKILEARNFQNLCSIRKIRGNGTIIVSVLSKKITKNKNILLEVEDLSGNGIVIINKERRELFEKGEGVLEDDVVAIEISGCGQGGMFFAKDLYYPDSFLSEKKTGDDKYMVFSGDFHVGSKFFLEEGVLKFIRWLNGEEGGDEEKNIAKKVKYLFLLGDNIDGVGHYPEQERYLNEKTSKGQYKKFEDLLRLIREDIEIVICPGQHDSVWVGEPQPKLSERWVGGLYEMKNVHLVSNPAVVSAGGFRVLMYHGASINRFIDELPGIRAKFGHKFPTKVMKEMLKRRHLSPLHGVMDYIPTEGRDNLVISELPDVFVVGDQHVVDVSIYNNVLMIAGSCWQSKTPFDEKMGNISDPCKVPVLNPKTRDIKIFDFNDEIKMSEVEVNENWG